MTTAAGSGALLFVGHLSVFTVAALACFASIPRARRITDADTRRGLVGLLATSGVWAASTVGFLLASTPRTAIAFYLLGLAAGLAAVGAWLYFSSAYTGRSLHRSPALRRLAVGIFLAVMLLKLVNPWGLYHATAAVETPFPHLAVQPGVLHWLAMALSYALAFVGYFMLLERFHAIDLDARPLVVLVSLTALPAVADVVGATTPYLVDVTYEPLGVAAFAVGVLFVYLDAFRTVQLTSDQDAPAIYLDEDRRVREYNQPALELYPGLEGAAGQPLADLLPGVADRLDGDDPIIGRDRDGTTRYYRVTASPFTAGETRIGELVTITDVTDAEQYRRELERKSEQLESFASVVAHDLRNPLNVAQGYLDIEREDRESEALDAIAESHARMRTIIDDLLALAREGLDVGETEPVSLADTAEQSWQDVDTTEASLVVEDDVELVADASRLQQLLENLFRNAVEHARPDVTVTVGALAEAPESEASGGSPERRSGGVSTSEASGGSPERRSGGVSTSEASGGSPERRSGGVSTSEASGGSNDERSESFGGFYVEDDGPGIPPDERDAVFDAGFSTSEDGTGFGLSIVAQVAEGHGWRVRATEGATGGARFEFSGVETG